MKPTVCSSAPIGSSSSPKVSARWNTTSVSVEPWMSANSAGSTASIRSRRSLWKSAMKPLCTNSQRPSRKGWQLVSCTGEPIAAARAPGTAATRCAPPARAGWRPTRPARRCGRRPAPRRRRTTRARSRRRSSVSAPRRECRLWSTIPCCVLNSSSSISTRLPVPRHPPAHRRLLVRGEGSLARGRRGCEGACTRIRVRQPPRVPSGFRLLTRRTGGPPSSPQCRADLDHDEHEAGAAERATHPVGATCQLPHAHAARPA